MPYTECTDRRIKCDDCEWVGKESQRLGPVPNPFDATYEVRGCPECKGIDCFHHLCDFEGCPRTASNGTTHPSGYKLTCYEHRPTE